MGRPVAKASDGLSVIRTSASVLDVGSAWLVDVAASDVSTSAVDGAAIGDVDVASTSCEVGVPDSVSDKSAVISS